MSDESPKSEDAVALLSEVRQAWQQLRGAKATMHRLGKYSRMHPGMVTDYERAHKVATDAERTINRILGGT